MFNQRSFLALLGGALIALLLAVFWTIKIGRAESGSAWLSTASLNLQKQSDLSVPPRSINGNIDCFPELPAGCAVVLPYGTANTAGAVSLGGPNDYRPVISYIDNRPHYIPVPNSNEFITYTTEPATGFYLYFNYNFLGSVKKLNQGLGDYFQVTKSPNGILTDQTGRKLAADYGSLSFSENGGWLVVSEPNVAMLRVNLQTFEVLPFAPSLNYSLGLSPEFKTAVTGDGRFAAVASKNFSYFRLYDLSTCAQVPALISGPVSCQYRDLQSYAQKTINGFSGISSLRFIDDDTLSFYASYNQGAEHKTAKYILANSNRSTNQQDYLALGDSYISGEGAYGYLPGTDTPDNQCHVSNISYPLLSGRQLSYDSFHSVACSGAETKDIADTSVSYTGQAKPFSKRQDLENAGLVSGILSNFQPGYIDQLDFIKQYQPKVVTVSIGGNDIGFSDRLRQCLGLDTCYKTYEDRLEFVQEVNKAFPKLVNTYSKIKSLGAADARVYIIGYPQIAKADGDCAVNVHMNQDELVFAAQAIDYLDSVVKAAASRAGVLYVDAQTAFDGHRLCEAGAGSVAVNGLTAGNDFPDKLGGPIGRESYHPNEFGHLLLENRLLSATHNLTSPMPEPDPSSSLPSQDGLEMLNVSKTGRDVSQTEYDSGLLPDIIYKGSPIDINLIGSAHGLKPFTSLSGELHSNPIRLGTITTNAEGSFAGQLSIPSEIPAGFHSLHLFGTNVAAQPVDIFKIVFVAGTADDLDGNGIADSRQKCVVVEPAGHDFDEDGVDDSCDEEIKLPPAGTSQPAPTPAQNPSSTSGLIVSTGQSVSPVQSQDQIIWAADPHTTKPKVLAASTAKLSSQPLTQTFGLSTRLFLYGFGILLLLIFALSLV